METVWSYISPQRNSQVLERAASAANTDEPSSLAALILFYDHMILYVYFTK